jgi:rubrerythrin
MGRKRKTNSEAEFELQREIEDLKQQVAKLKKTIRQFEKVEKEQNLNKEEKKEQKPKAYDCPKCGAVLKKSELPFGLLLICETGCGFREVKRN